MAVEVVWEDEAHTILRYIYQGIWAWDEAYTAIAQARQMMADGPNTVDCIVDMTAGQRIPIGNAIIQIRKMGEMGQNMTHYSGLTVFVKADAFLKTLLHVYEQVYPQQANNLILPHVATLEEAIAYIEQQRKPTPTSDEA
jgi:hypothetical protein